LIIRSIEKYDVKLSGEEKVDGMDCYVIEATPKRVFLPQKKLWIDKEAFRLVRLVSTIQA